MSVQNGVQEDEFGVGGVRWIGWGGPQCVETREAALGDGRESCVTLGWPLQPCPPKHCQTYRKSGGCQLTVVRQSRESEQQPRLVFLLCLLALPGANTSQGLGSFPEECV